MTRLAIASKTRILGIVALAIFALGPVLAAGALTGDLKGGAAYAQVPGGVGAAIPPGSNVLFVLTDDMRFDDMQYLPHIQQLVGDAGVIFDAELDNVTLCCPARTSILRGQYSHNTTVLTNGGNNGGFETAYSNHVEASTIGTAMHAAGYTTGLFGKYLNGYPNTAGSAYIPPGWDGWASSIAGNAYSEYNYTLNENGNQVHYARRPEDYGTDVYVGHAKQFVTDAAHAGKPFFVYLAVYAPHQPATPAPQDQQAFPGLEAPRDAAYNEADVSDKPEYIQRLQPLSDRQKTNIDNLYRRRAQSLQAVDRGVADLVDTLRQNGQLDNTYIIFTSDNGFHLGQHRMPSGKQTAYETDIHLPLMMRGPGITAGAHVSAITGNIDLAPTIAALGGATLTDNPDGRSLVPFLKGAPAGQPAIVPAPADWRQVYLLEHWTENSVAQDRSGAAQLEPDDPDQGGITPGDTPGRLSGATVVRGIPEFAGLRAAGYTYVEYVTGERELYDLKADPDELQNIASTANSSLLAMLHDRLTGLRTCAGDACRQAESAPLTIPA